MINMLDDKVFLVGELFFPKMCIAVHKHYSQKLIVTYGNEFNAQTTRNNSGTK